MNSLRKITSETIVLSLTILLIPFIKNPQLLDQKLLPCHILMVMSSLALLIHLFVRKEIYIGKKFIINALPLGILLCSYLLTSYFAYNLSEAIFWTFKIGTYFTFFSLLYILVINKRIDIEIISYSVLIVLSISIFHLIYEISKEGIETMYQIKSLFLHKNLFSLFTVLCIPFVIHIGFDQNKKWLKTYSAIILLILPMIYLFIHSKAVLFAAILSLLFVVLMTIIKSQKKYFTKRNVLLLAGALSIVLALTYLNKDVVYNLESFNERKVVWENTVEIIKDHPNGVGGGNWQIFFPKYGLEEFSLLNEAVSNGVQTYQRPHNDYLWVLSEAGFLGLFAFLFFIFILFRGFNNIFHPTINHKNKLFSNALLFALITFFIVSFFDFPLERSEHQIVFLICAVFLIDSTQKHHNKFKLNKLLLIPFLFILIASLYFSNNKMQAEIMGYKTVQDFHQQEWESIISKADFFEDNEYKLDNYSIPYLWYVGMAYYATNDKVNSIKYLEQAHQFAPYQTQVINSLASAHAKNNNFEKAHQYFDQSLEISPTNEEIILNKAILYASEGNIDFAFNTFIEIPYRKEAGKQYHQAFDYIFDVYLNIQLEKNSYNNKSIENIIESDSLKKVVLYEYQFNDRTMEYLLNQFEFY